MFTLIRRIMAVDVHNPVCSTILPRLNGWPEQHSVFVLADGSEKQGKSNFFPHHTVSLEDSFTIHSAHGKSSSADRECWSQHTVALEDGSALHNTHGNSSSTDGERALRHTVVLEDGPALHSVHSNSSSADGDMLLIPGCSSILPSRKRMARSARDGVNIMVRKV